MVGCLAIQNDGGGKSVIGLVPFMVLHLYKIAPKMG